MKGQMEMLGLVFIIVLIALGILLYLRLAPEVDSAPAAKEVQFATSFLTALAETDVPACGTSVARVAADCSMNNNEACNACEQLDLAFGTILAATLDKQYVSYHLALENSNVEYGENCQSDQYAPSIPVPSTPPSKITLTICR